MSSTKGKGQNEQQNTDTQCGTTIGTEIVEANNLCKHMALTRQSVVVLLCRTSKRKGVKICVKR